MSVNVEITGKLIVKNEEKQLSEKFKKREFVLYVENEKNPDYSDKIKVELKQDRCDLIEPIGVGEDVRVQCNVTGRAWTNKEGVEMFFNTIEAWRVERVANQAPSAPPVPSHDTPEDDGLPF